MHVLYVRKNMIRNFLAFATLFGVASCEKDQPLIERHSKAEHDIVIQVTDGGRSVTTANHLHLEQLRTHLTPKGYAGDWIRVYDSIAEIDSAIVISYSVNYSEIFISYDLENEASLLLKHNDNDYEFNLSSGYNTLRRDL